MMQKNTQVTAPTILTTKPRTLAWFCMLALAMLLLLAACGGGGTTSSPTPTTAPTATTASTATTAPSPTATSGSSTMVTVITDSSGRFAFSPPSLTVSVGMTVTWQNMSSAPHTVTSDDGTTFNGMLPTGGTFTFMFTKAGTFAYHCNIHPYMKATIIVH